MSWKVLVCFVVTLSLYLLLKPQQVQAGTCKFVYGPYSDAECNAAKAAAQNLSCLPGSYSYYSCNKGDPNRYCYGCHVVAACGGSAYPSCGGGCSAGYECKSGSGSCECKASTTGLAGCYEWVDDCTKSGSGDQCGWTNTTPRQPKYVDRQCACRRQQTSAPTLLSPANNSNLSNYTVTLSWTGGDDGISGTTDCGNTVGTYEVWVGETEDTMALLGKKPMTNPTTTSSMSYTDPDGGVNYWKVVVAVPILPRGESETWKFTIGQPQLSGRVYYDPNNTCASSLAIPWSRGTGMSVAVSGQGSAAVSETNGAYSRNTTTAGPFTLTLNGIPAGYQCAACATCELYGVASPSTNNNFYVNEILIGEAWWQAAGAGVYAGLAGGGTTIQSDLPTADSRLVIPGTADLAAIVRASGSIDYGAGQVSETNWAAVSRYEGKKMDYRFFAAQMGVTLGTEDMFVSDELTKPTTEEEFYLARPISGTATLDNSWGVVEADESYVVFVDGNLSIGSNVTVIPGGFLAFIVRGGVTVAPTVANVEGIYVMDQVFTTQTGGAENDPQLVTGGMIVAWQGVSLNRDLGGETNYTTPAEQFSYRPDLLVNMPEKMKSFALRWQEVTPGTID